MTNKSVTAMTPIGRVTGTKTFLLRWRTEAKRWYRQLFGPGLLGDFTVLHRTLRIGTGVGGGVGLVLAVSTNTWIPVPALLLAGPFVALTAAVLVAGALTLGTTVNATWVRSPERRLRRLEHRITELARHLENSVVSIAGIPERDARLEKLHDAIVYEEIRRRAFPDNGASLGELSARMNRLDGEERARVLHHIKSPQALAEAERIIDVPYGAPVIRVFERRGLVRAEGIYALALDILLGRYVIARAAGGDLILLVEAPAGFAACLELDGWLPRGEAAGPVDDAERETIISLWDEGSSRVYTDAVELLDAAERL